MGQTSSRTQRTRTETRADIYQRITDRIAAAIEAGAGAWRMPWHPGADGVAPLLPVNAASGKAYRGVNIVVLWATAQAEGYPSAIWATYRQWAELGAQVRRGERSSPVVFWKISDKDEQEDGDEGMLNIVECVAEVLEAVLPGGTRHVRGQDHVLQTE